MVIFLFAVLSKNSKKCTVRVSFIAKTATTPFVRTNAPTGKKIPK